MNIYLLDDDINIVKKLEYIIESEDLGNIIGYNDQSPEAIEEIKKLNPDIVLIDILMPKINGIDVVHELSYLSNLNFIMISQVSNKDIISEAYDAGIEFFISKPIIKSEVMKVVENIKSKIILQKAMRNIGQINVKPSHEKRMYIIKKIINNLGISGEKGIYDLIKIINYIIKNKLENREICLSKVCDQLHLNYRNTTQRIRRALTKGLENIAAEGIEDYYSYNFTEYGKTLYSFKEVRKMMNYILGKSTKKGSVNITQFIDSLLILSHKK